MHTSLHFFVLYFTLFFCALPISCNHSSKKNWNNHKNSKKKKTLKNTLTQHWTTTQNQTSCNHIFNPTFLFRALFLSSSIAIKPLKNHQARVMNVYTSHGALHLI
jgi:hypothetical protein